MNADANKIGGKKNEATKEYPEYFLIRRMDDCLADSTMDTISLFEKSLTSGMSHVSTNMKWIVMNVEMQIQASLYAGADGLIPGCPDDRVR